jgi:hypothetical protein
MASYQLIYNDLSHPTSTIGRDETVFYIIKFSCITNINITFYPAMTAFTDQYSLPNIFFDIGQL